jgi:hypothetical protein
MHNRAMHFGVRWRSRHAEHASAFHLRDRRFDSVSLPTQDMRKESVDALPKVVGFLLVLRFLSQGTLTGWVRINTVKKVN